MKFIAILLIAFATFAVAIPLEMEQVSSSEQMEVSADESSVSSAEESPLEETSETEAVDVESSAESEEEPQFSELEEEASLPEEESIESSEEEPVEDEDNFAKYVREKMNFCVRPRTSNNWKPVCITKAACKTAQCKTCKKNTCKLVNMEGSKKAWKTIKKLVHDYYESCEKKGDEDSCNPFHLTKEEKKRHSTSRGSWWHSIMGADTDADEPEFDEQAEPEIEDIQYTDDEQSMPFAESEL